MVDKVCKHYYVNGSVQGVGFRAFTKIQAKRLNITGWVRNLADGRVEVLACGKEAEMTTFYTLLKRGPSIATVTDVAEETLPWQKHEDFLVL